MEEAAQAAKEVEAKMPEPVEMAEKVEEREAEPA